MQKSKQHFFIATTALLLSAPFASATAAPVIEITAALSQPTIVAGSSLALANPFSDTLPALDRAAMKSAPSSTKAKRGEEPANEPSHWSMLLVGAGVLLLPRKRRVDNAVR